MEDIASPEDNQEMVEAIKLLEKIAENPYEYEAHTEYITILRKNGAADDLRQAREVFHSFFPFSEGILPI
jgi:squamous cell carcinoma antigen recognized by T-cells 3